MVEVGSRPPAGPRATHMATEGLLAGGLLALLRDPTVATVSLGALLLGLTAGALGTFATLRRQSLLGDAMSHAALPGVVGGYLLAGTRSLPAMLAGALVTGLLAALLALLLTRRGIKSEAALGAALGTGFALGVVLLSYVQRQPGAGGAGLEVFLFGQAAATLRSDVLVIGTLAVAALGLVLLLFERLKLVTFDPQFARAGGVRVGLYDALFTGLLALVIVIGLQLVGVVLMSALVVAPAVAARQFSRSLGTMFWLAGAVGAFSAVSGALLSSLIPGLATGPTIVVVASLAALVALVATRGRGLVAEGV